MDTIKEGVIVRLKPSVNWHGCPEGRIDNKTAKVLHVYGEERDRVMMEQDLEGCLFWNMNDLEVVE